MMPVVPNGAPRFVESSHGQGSGWLGPVFNPMRIDADGSKPDYNIGELALHAELHAVRLGGPARLPRSLDPQVRAIQSAPAPAPMPNPQRPAFSPLPPPD